MEMQEIWRMVSREPRKNIHVTMVGFFGDFLGFFPVCREVERFVFVSLYDLLAQD